MATICAEYHHHHHSHPLFSPRKPVQDLNLPPRKLLNRRSKLPISISPHHHFIDENPRLLQTNNEEENRVFDDEEEEPDPYASDEFRIYEFKIRRCMRSRSHDWTDCPFAHPGEKARRRDPRRFHYSGNPCSDFRKGSCPRGDSCEFAHGVFECWLHPAKYRTQACKDGKNCRRKVCFFAHSPREIRILPSGSQFSSSHCCGFCNSVASSPTSTLMGFSHSSPSTLSPPLSPNNNRLKEGFSLISRFNEGCSTNVNSTYSNRSFVRYLSYKNALIELVSSLEGMDVGAGSATCVNGNLFNGGGVSPNLENQQQFLLSPTTTNHIGSRDIFNEDSLVNNGGPCPDIEWVNELVM